MKPISRELAEYMDRRLEVAVVPARERPAWRKWMRYYFDFCVKYGHPARSGAGLGPFWEKLASKGQTRMPLF